MSTPIFLKDYLALGFALGALTRAAGSQATCFTPHERSPFYIIQQAPPPISDGATSYDFYPLTAAATGQLERIVHSRSSVEKIYWQWANHGPRSTDGGAKGNITPGSPGVQIRFSSIAAADACTMAQTEAALGREPQRGASPLLRLVEGRQTSDTLDVCIVPNEPTPPGSPILLDYEVADGRSPLETAGFLVRWSKLVHAERRKAILYSNALDAPSQKYSNLTPVAAQVGNNFDLVHVLISSRNAGVRLEESFNYQIRSYLVEASKIIVTFELNGTSIEDAKAVNEILRSKKATGVNFWRNYAKEGGSCGTETNQKIACVAFGRC